MGAMLLILNETDRGLEMTPTAEGVESAKRLLAEGRGGLDGLSDMLEHPIGNGWNWIPPEAIGALTDAPILSEDCTLADSGAWEFFFEMPAPHPCVYAHMNYQVEDPIATWARGETVHWQRATVERSAT